MWKAALMAQDHEIENILLQGGVDVPQNQQLGSPRVEDFLPVSRPFTFRCIAKFADNTYWQYSNEPSRNQLLIEDGTVDPKDVFKSSMTQDPMLQNPFLEG